MRLRVAAALVAGVALTATAVAQDLPKTAFKVVGTWSNLTNYQQNEQPFWTKTLPEASKGQITANLQSLSELGLKGTEIIRLVKLGLFDFAHGLPIYVAEDATVEGIDVAGVAKTFDMARKTVDAYAPILNATFEKSLVFLGFVIISVFGEVAHLDSGPQTLRQFLAASTCKFCQLCFEFGFAFRC